MLLQTYSHQPTVNSAHSRSYVTYNIIGLFNNHESKHASLMYIRALHATLVDYQLVIMDSNVNHRTDAQSQNADQLGRTDQELPLSSSSATEFLTLVLSGDCAYLDPGVSEIIGAVREEVLVSSVDYGELVEGLKREGEEGGVKD